MADPAGLAISIKDKVAIGLILFFTTVALTLELYWLINHQEMEARTDLFARLLSIYWPADRTYRIPGYPIEKAFTLSLEGLGKHIECPLFVIAAGLDRLCPPEDAERLARETKGPTTLLVVEDGNHVAHNRFYKYRGRSADWMAQQLGA